MILFGLTLPASGQFGKIVEGLGKRGGSSDSKTASGLKEALAVGTENAVQLTGTTDGFFQNAAIKILMPSQLRTFEKGLRLAGMGSKVDQFELSMNRAAERAAPAAKNIFKDALTKMTFTDAKSILLGSDTAATEYFKEKTSDQLKTAFRPTVESAMGETGVGEHFEQLVASIQKLPFGRSMNLDITDYVVGKTMDGLFHVLGEEEKKIRTNPAAQITPLLKEVFGKR